MSEFLQVNEIIVFLVAIFYAGDARQAPTIPIEEKPITYDEKKV